MKQTEPLIPDYTKDNIALLSSELLYPGSANLPVNFGNNKRRVLFIIDGLGYNQLKERPEIAPTLTSLSGGPISSVAPSTTAAGLTSITTGLTPGEHGVVGYRFVLDGQVMNALSWRNRKGQLMAKSNPPELTQPYDPFLNHDIAYISNSMFADTAFTKAHLRGADQFGYSTTAIMLEQLKTLIAAKSDTIYVYYDGLDKVGHQYGVGDFYNGELKFIDSLVSDMIEILGDDYQIMISADHGMITCADPSLKLPEEITANTQLLSGEGRFRWLHCKPEATEELAATALEHFSDVAWVKTIEQIVDENWFGKISHEVLSRYGQVALVAKTNVSFEDHDDTGKFPLVGRHGSLTEDEMLVPCLISS